MLFKRIQLNTLLGNMDEEYEFPFMVNSDLSVQLQDPSDGSTCSKTSHKGSVTGKKRDRKMWEKTQSTMSDITLVPFND